MIRKISVQDVVSKRDEPGSGAASRRERDYLIERLTRKHSSAEPSIVESPTKVKKTMPRRKTSSSKFFHFGHKWIWLSAPLVIALFVLVVLQFMVSATITVKPKQITVPVDTKLAATFNTATSPSTLTYQIITLTVADSETVEATGVVATKPQKASGQITIFNSYGTASQTLVANTRFETADGLIYRIQNATSIPGYTTSDGKTVPGSVTVTVVADQVGSKYNIDTVDFTIPGFKTNPDRYAKIVARSKTAMIGGSNGNSLGVSDVARQTAQTNIEARLKDTLLHQIQAQKTANSVIFDSASKISFQRLPDTAGIDAQHAIINEVGVISSVVFDKKTLGKLLLGDAIAKVGNNAEVRGIESLHFIAAVSSTSNVWPAKPLNFTLTGPVDVIGVVDADKLLKDVLGIPRSDLAKVLSNYPTIDKATASVKPFWKNSFPADATKIKIEVVK